MDQKACVQNICLFDSPMMFPQCLKGKLDFSPLYFHSNFTFHSPFCPSSILLMATWSLNTCFIQEEKGNKMLKITQINKETWNRKEWGKTLKGKFQNERKWIFASSSSLPKLKTKQSEKKVQVFHSFIVPRFQIKL